MDTESSDKIPLQNYPSGDALFNKEIRNLINAQWKDSRILALALIAIPFLVFLYLKGTLFNIINEDEAIEMARYFAITKYSSDYISSFFLSSFTHFAWWHLLSNCLFFYIMAKQITAFFNVTNLFKVCLISWIFSSALSYIHIIFLQPELDIYLIGFSGIVASLWGALFYYMSPKEKIFNSLFMLVFHFYFIFASDINIAWYTHLYGAIAGFAYAYFVKYTHHDKLIQIAYSRTAKWYTPLKLSS